MVVPSTMFNVYDTPNSETHVSKLLLNFPVVNMTWEPVHVQFPIMKLVFTIISDSKWRQQLLHLLHNTAYLKHRTSKQETLSERETQRKRNWSVVELLSVGVSVVKQ